MLRKHPYFKDYFVHTGFLIKTKKEGVVGKVKERASILYKGALFNIIFDSLIIPFYGYKGAALVTSLGMFLIFVLSTKFLKKELKFKTSLKQTTKLLIF